MTKVKQVWNQAHQIKFETPQMYIISQDTGYVFKVDVIIISLKQGYTVMEAYHLI